MFSSQFIMPIDNSNIHTVYTMCESHFLYSEIDAKIKCDLYTGQSKRECNIWHDLGGNTIILFFNLDNEFMNNKQIY